jgi:hypothetical protein
MLFSANPFEISDIERMNIGRASQVLQDVTMLHALWKITIRQPHFEIVAENSWNGGHPHRLPGPDHDRVKLFFMS